MANVDDVVAKLGEPGADPELQRAFGHGENDMGKLTGLDKAFAYNIVKQVGNYGEVFEANIGTATSIGLARGLNALWTQGGLQYAPPIR
jgi:general L-amino acid transport system substrate-binding protein